MADPHLVRAREKPGRADWRYLRAINADLIGLILAGELTRCSTC